MELKLLNELKVISAKLGANPMLIQGPGGNSSLKIGDKMFIKASGQWLLDAINKNIFVEVAWNKINQNINLNEKDPLKGANIGNSNLRPSIETTLHALMPHKIVFHTHPVELLSLLVQINAKDLLNDILSDLNWSWVDYSCPGLDLTINAQLALKDNNSDILILGNHGLLVGSDSCEEVVDLTEKLTNRFKKTKRSFESPNSEKLKIFAEKINMKPVNNNNIHALAVDEVCYKYCNTKSTILYPDQAVFLGPKLNCLDSNNYQYKDFLKDTYQYAIVRETGVFVNENCKPEIEYMLNCHSEILLRVPKKKNLRYLSSDEVSKLVNWEAEKYRQNLKR